MYTGPFPTASIYGTWSENMEIRAADDDELMDLSTVTEVTLKLRDQMWRTDEMILTMSNGDITIPSNGIIQWRVEAAAMGTLTPKTYEVVVTIEDDTDKVPIALGSVSIVE